jgi:dipeptidyl aminopeptidase/acylaminoacyl peptidase
VRAARRRSAALLLLVALPAAAAAAQAPRGLTPDLAAGMRQLGGIRISPDGSRVAYVVTVPDLATSTTNADVWVVPAAGGEPRRLTRGRTRDDSPLWSPDGTRLAFISDREERPQVWLIRADGGEAERLTESKSGVTAFAWSPDGRRIAFVAPRDRTADEERREKERDDAHVVDREFRATWLWVIDVATRAATGIVTDDGQVQDPQWSPDGTRIAYVALPTPRADDGRFADVRVVDVATRASRRLLDNPGPDVAPRWSPDGRSIALLTRGPRNAGILQSRLAVVPAEGGPAREVVRDFLHEPGPPAWSPDGATLYFWSQVRTRSRLFAVPAGGGVPRPLGDTPGSLGIFGGGAPSLSADGRTVAFGWSDLSAPDDVYVAATAGAWAPRRLTRLHPEVDSLPMGRGEVVRWRSTDGLEIEGIVVYPVGYQAGRRYPTVVHVHGGPSGIWNESFGANWYNSAQVYASQGWVSFLPNPRGSGGYGDGFLMANYRDWGGGDFRDIQTGLDELVRRGIADSTRLVQTGWSYGGYMTAWTLTQTSRFKALMVGAGLTNMYSMYSTNDLQTLLEEYFGAEPWDDEAAYRRASAMFHIRQARTPTLILHGQQDTRVPVGQAQELYMGLRKNGVPVELVFYPREPHGLLEPAHMRDKIARELAFFSRYALGQEPAPAAPVP